MFKDLPYSILKQDGRAYEIMLLRDQYANTFADMAKAYEMAVARVAHIYNSMKVKQIRLYIQHIAAALGYEDASKVRQVYQDAYECYQDRAYACAYLEKKYKSILDEYRGGEPGMPVQFVRRMPPFKPKPDKKTIARVIEMREVEKASYTAIAKELRMTPAKARHTYEWFYHRQVLALIKALQSKAGSYEEKMAIWEHYFKEYKTPKKRYDALTR